MNYNQGQAYLRHFSANITNTNELYSNTYTPLDDYPYLILLYPGRKGIYDYKIKHNNYSTTYIDIVNYLYNVTRKNRYIDLANFLLDIYRNGLYANHNIKLYLNNVPLNNRIITTNQLKHIIFWITLQEEINYPRPKYQGIRLPFKRYVEAIISSIYPNIITLHQVQTRTNNHGRSVPPPLNTQNLPPDLTTVLNAL